jgi:hypothetical protein
MPNDPVADALKTPEAQAAEALRIAKELEDKLNRSPESNGSTLDPNSPEFREKLKTETGMTDKQIDFVQSTAIAASANANASAALAELKSKHPDFEKFEKSFMEELKNYPLVKQGDVKLLEKIYYMEKGKAGPVVTPRNPAAPLRGGGFDTGLGSNDNGGGGPETLTDQERYVARRMNVSEKDYARAKTTTLIHELK